LNKSLRNFNPGLPNAAGPECVAPSHVGRLSKASDCAAGKGELL
jgi:hypothetical protein